MSVKLLEMTNKDTYRSGGADARTYVYRYAAYDYTLVWNFSTVQPFNSSTFFYTHDGNKNVSEVIASAGTLAAHYEYAPFGALTVSRGASAADNPWRFSSEYAEDDTATVYYNYRHYEPVMGRWMARDPLFESAGANLIAFVGNDVLDYIDMFGLSLGKSNWLTKRGHTHEELTKDSFPFHNEYPGQCIFDKSSAILDFLINANIRTDAEDATKDKQEYHYCTGLRKIREGNCDTWDYDGYKEAYKNTLSSLREQFDSDISASNKSNCKEALSVLGTMIHMWQDYYSHGVTDDGWFNGDEGAIKGSPDDPQMTPDSFGWYGFRGGHGGLFRLLNPFTRVEPGDRADDSEERRKQAVDFVNKKLLDLLPKWAAKCCCEW